MSEDGLRSNRKMTDHASALIAEVAACVRFFSRLPLPSLTSADRIEALPDFSKIARAIPLAALVVSLPASLAGLLIGLTDLPALATSILIVGLLVMTTGALHEDGLADVADGFFGGATRERRLEIMKDSRIGTFGAVALILSLGLKVVLIAALLDQHGPLTAMIMLLSAECLSRTLMIWQWHALPSARPDGLGNRFGVPGLSMVFQAIVVTTVLLIPSAIVLPVIPLSLGLLIAFAMAYGIGRLSLQKIGGFTGDVLGAIQQMTALSFLAGTLLVS